MPMVRTHADPWIFITPHPNILQPLLLSRSLPARAKFKLGLSHDPDSGSVIAKSVCFFCNEGNPKIVPYLVKPEFDTEFNYFPDYTVNLNGKLLRISCPSVLSRLELKTPYLRNEVNNAKRGLWKPLLEEYLIPKLNFSYHFFLSTGSDGSSDRKKGGSGSGIELPNGTWIG
jgi:hypothetical protein